MKNENENAFLKSIAGTSPIKKNNKIKKPIPKIKDNNKDITTVAPTEEPIHINKIKENISKSIFILEKTNINKKLKKGKIPVDKKFDFHGLSVQESEDLFTRSIRDCYKKNLRCILFITGKGIYKKNYNEDSGIKLYYGKIRENFFIWVNRPEFQKYILSVEVAGMEHGADGAFFIYLRKQKY